MAVGTRLTSGRGECQVRPPVTSCRLSRRFGGTVCAPESAAIQSVTIPQDGLRELDRVSAPDLNYPYPWLAPIAVPLTQSGGRT